VWQVAAERGGPKLALTVDADRGPVVVWANRAAQDLLSTDSADIVGCALDQIEQPELTHVTDWRSAVNQLLDGGGGEARAELALADGTVQPLEVTLVPAHGIPGAEPEAWLVILRPTVEEVLLARAAARQAEHRFTALATNSPVGIFMSDVGLRLGYVNDRFVELAGLGARHLLGTGWLDVVHKQDIPDLYDALQSVMAGGDEEVTVRIQPVSGIERWLQVRLTPVTTTQRGAGFLGVAEDITTRRAWEEQLIYQASHDSLTGLANRRRLTETITDLLESRRAHDRRFAVIFCDLDGFKQVNDEYGHDAGDRVLIEVARRLTRTAREYDTVGRLAGDEFVIVLRDVWSPADAESAAKRQLVALSRPFFFGNTQVDISASLGVAMPGEQDDAESLLRQADRLMYLAKASGPGQYLLSVDGGGA
jgi:diguanylate cyclase (GGDEF)-like protein/PAS domain S-box-containing protein